MAARNTTADTTTTTSLALVSAEHLDAWLDNPENYNTVPIMKKGKKVGERKVRKTLTLSTGATTPLYVAACQYASSYPGGLDSNDVAPGFLGRAVRKASFGLFLPEVDVEAWESDRAERISSDRSDRMSRVASERGITLEAVNTKLSVLERLLANPKMRSVALAEASDDPELAELLEIMQAGDNES